MIIIDVLIYLLAFIGLITVIWAVIILRMMLTDEKEDMTMESRWSKR